MPSGKSLSAIVISMLKAIVFDFYGVIRDDSYQAWLKTHGYKREGSFLHVSQKLDSGQIKIEDFFEILSKLSGDPVDTIKNYFESIAGINSDVVNIIKDLYGFYHIALLSNSPSELIRKIIKENDLEKYFDEIVVSSEVGMVKPNKEIFEFIIDRLAIDSSEILFIDDNKLYVEAAEKAGIKSIQFISAVKLKSDLYELGKDYEKIVK
ncbi:MAG TPA: HAD family phosphatase [Candidatus Saccharimonadales bacterium]|nr:HAD family phosphatase [Candidatus Saccharimonadales bacterium]